MTEDYVSFETAKLLKEKGFKIPYDSFRGVYINGIFKRLNPGGAYGYNLGDEIVDVCSLQIAMKWLREVHKYHIFTIPRFEDVEYMPGEWEEQMTGYQYVIIDISGAHRKINQPVEQRALTVESSYEEAIKFCLKKIGFKMAATIVKKCNCESKFQDERYGKGMRLMNMRNPQKHKNEAVCTVCGTKHNL